jgi:hypothetical protein
MGVPSRGVMTVLIIAAVVIGVAVGYWLFVALT